MKRSTPIFVLACALFAVAWFVPVIDGGTSLAKGGLPGWEALKAALSPLWDPAARDSWTAILAVPSGVSNLWFVAAVAARTGRLRLSSPVVRRGAIVAALINAQWLSSFRELRAGYYLWLVSFVLLAIASASEQQ
ncbi:MAG: hypothetical protein ACREN6_00770 [Gemmatimonadaceae bacterium]